MKTISKKHEKKIQSYLPEVQTFYLQCKNLDLNKKYSIEGMETKIKGIDILALMNIIYKQKNENTNHFTVHFRTSLRSKLLPDANEI